MNRRSWYRRVVSAGVVAALACATIATLGAPASADTPVVALSVSPATVSPGDTVTVTETLTNSNGFTILGPTAQLFSSQDNITGYTTLAGCDAGVGGVCATLLDGSGNPDGYVATFGAALGGNSSVTATFTLKINPNLTASAVETLEGALVGVNFATDVTPGPTLTINARADVAVAMTATPKQGLLSLTLNFAVTVTNNGPGTLSSAQITTTVPRGLTARSSATCTATRTGALCSVGPVPSGGKATATFSVPLGLLDVGLPFTFTAARTASTPADPNSANDSASVSCTSLSILLASCGATPQAAAAGMKQLLADARH